MLCTRLAAANSLQPPFNVALQLFLTQALHASVPELRSAACTAHPLRNRGSSACVPCWYLHDAANLAAHQSSTHNIHQLYYLNRVTDCILILRNIPCPYSSVLCLTLDTEHTPGPNQSTLTPHLFVYLSLPNLLPRSSHLRHGCCCRQITTPSVVPLLLSAKACPCTCL